MRNLTAQELASAPPKIIQLYMLGIAQIPVGGSLIEAAIRDHPEYFPDTLALRQAWARVPSEVKAAHDAELERLVAPIRVGRGPGLRIFIDDAPEARDWSRRWDEAAPKLRAVHRALHERYYGPYGIEWKETLGVYA